MKEKKWEIHKKLKTQNGKTNIEDILTLLLANRGIKTQKEKEAFLHSDIHTVSSKTVGIDAKQLKKALKRIRKAIEQKEQIVVFGDYDVDGITGTAILWETLHALGAMVVPYIPSRIDEGYGLSKAGISNVQNEISNIKLIITVDNGIVANEAVDFANQKGIDVIITDHHTIGKELPKAYAIVHTTNVCGAGVAWILSQEILNLKPSTSSGKKFSVVSTSNYSLSEQSESKGSVPADHLSLVALATVADLVPLTGANRILLRFGLAELHDTMRPGLLALCHEAMIEKENIGVYEIGHIIAPRLNAMGRLESAMDSLRLLCTKDRLRAKVLADTLTRTNKERQLLTQSASSHAIEAFRGKQLKKLLFIAHEEYEEGVIGLVAGKLVEEFYLPAIVLSKGETVSKASARSIAGFNIIDFIRSSSHLLINAGGHPMAAGFTVETQNIIALQEALEKLAEEQIVADMLHRVLRIDCEIPLNIVSPEFFMQLQKLAPFGMGNPEPTFVSSAIVTEVKTVGKEKQHLKLKISNVKYPMSSTTNVIPAEAGHGTQNGGIQSLRHSGEPKATPESGFRQTSATFSSSARITLDAIGFGLGHKASELKPGDNIQIVYTISENTWQGKVNLQLKVKDIK